MFGIQTQLFMLARQARYFLKHLPSSTAEAKVKGSVWHPGYRLGTQEVVFGISGCHFHHSLAAAELRGTGILDGDTTCVYC